MKTAVPTQTKELVSANVGAQFRWENINEPGTYYSNWSGHLIRIPEYAFLKEGTAPAIDIRGKEPMLVTKLSDDPFVPVSQVRMVAANLDLPVNF